MVKVHNGWESNSLEEIESLTSQHASPRSPLTAISLSSTPRKLYSPKAAINPSLRRQGSSSLSSEGVPAAGSGSRVDGGAQGSHSHRQRAGSRPQKRALAPPADIIPRARRRPHHANPPLNGYKSVTSVNSIGAKQRTASQSAAMEADAVETLLFMASPGNSSHQPSSSRGMAPPAGMRAPTHSPNPPLRRGRSGHEILESPQRRAAYIGLPETIPTAAHITSKFDEIDRMIDEMDDTSTDDGMEGTNDLTTEQPGGEHAVLS